LVAYPHCSGRTIIDGRRQKSKIQNRNCAKMRREQLAASV